MPEGEWDAKKPGTTRRRIAPDHSLKIWKGPAMIRPVPAQTKGPRPPSASQNTVCEKTLANHLHSRDPFPF